MKKIIGLLAGILLVLGSLSACATTDKVNVKVGDTIKIGVSLELTGPVSAYGLAEKNGITLAVNQINAAGGILGKQVELVTYDNKATESEVSSIAVRLATEDKVVAIIGSATSGMTKVMIPISKEQNITVITPSGSNDTVTNDGAGKTYPFMFRTCFNDSFQGVVMANYASNSLNTKKAAILGNTDSDYSMGLKDVFKTQFTANGGTVVVDKSYGKDDVNFSAILTAIQSSDIDVIFIPDYYEKAGLLIKQAREAGITLPILGPDGFDAGSDIVNIALAENLNDVYFSTHFSVDVENALVTKFVTDYKAAFASDPMALSALGYDAVYILKAAIEEAGIKNGKISRTAINNAVTATKDFVGVTGTISLDALHNPIKSAVVIEFVNGVYSNPVLVNP